MNEDKWIERLLVLAEDKKELDAANSESSLIDFIYRVYDEMFEFQKNDQIIKIQKTEESFEMIIMNKRIVIIHDRGIRHLNFYVNQDLESGEDAVEFGKLSVQKKVFRYAQDFEVKLKFDRVLLEKIATDYFKPLTESVLSPTFSFN